MKRIILTADDYGMCREVNAGIEECLAAGALCSTCVMTNMPLAGEAATLQKNFPNASIGLHWTISQGQPVCAAKDVPTLVDEHGRFWKPLEFKRRWNKGLIQHGELKAELVAQHSRFVSIAGRPAYWNTHQNTHVIPGVFAFFVDVGMELGIPAMRCHRRILVMLNHSKILFLARHPMFLLKSWVISSYSSRAERLGMKMPRGLIYSPMFDRTIDLVGMLASSQLPKTKEPMEIIFHPAMGVVPELFGGLTTKRVDEWRILRDFKLRERLAQVGVECANFDL